MSQVSVKILQQDYVLSCPDGQENALLEAVAKANNAMQPLCDKAKVRTREQAAVLVAVNFAFQNQALQKHISQLEQQIAQLALSAQQASAHAQKAAEAAAAAAATSYSAHDQARSDSLAQRIDALLAAATTPAAPEAQSEPEPEPESRPSPLAPQVPQPTQQHEAEQKEQKEHPAQPAPQTNANANANINADIAMDVNGDTDTDAGALFDDSHQEGNDYGSTQAKPC